ncbi:MAG: hypothetical protein J7515_03115 [Caulobacter sp.]|nr:hypothetical protein [Caulobacter sp.]
MLSVLVLVSPLWAHAEVNLLTNGDFSQGAQGWKISNLDGGAEHYRLDFRDNMELSVAWGADAAPPSQQFFLASQTVDAASMRGAYATLTLRVKVDRARGLVGAVLRVDRPGGAIGFIDNMTDRPLPVSDWRDVVIHGPIAADATRIFVGVIVAGDSSARFDDLRLAAGPAPATSPAATNYLEHAMDLLQQHFYRSPSISWPDLRGQAEARTIGAQTTSDVYPALKMLVAALGEPHTRFIPPSTSDTSAPMGSDLVALPRGERVGRVGKLTLPGTVEGREAAYRAALDRAFAEASSGGTCGWIIDLRSNLGGNMWPMVAGLRPLVLPAPFGWFVAGDGARTPWTFDRPNSTMGGKPPAPGKARGEPVAVLLGPQTASSGEMVAVALSGRPETRSFGAATAGLTTANSPFLLSDDSRLLITTARVEDRAKTPVNGPISPDEPAADPEASARRWLEARGCSPIH